MPEGKEIKRVNIWPKAMGKEAGIENWERRISACAVSAWANTSRRDVLWGYCVNAHVLLHDAGDTYGMYILHVVLCLMYKCETYMNKIWNWNHVALHYGLHTLCTHCHQHVHLQIRTPIHLWSPWCPQRSDPNVETRDLCETIRFWYTRVCCRI